MEIVRLIDLPGQIRGFTVEDSEGDYNIYLNARLNRAMQLRAYDHEIGHIKNGDFDRTDAAEVERSAHGLS